MSPDRPDDIDVRVTARARSPLAAAAVVRAARAVLHAEGAHGASISLTFVGARRMRRLNEEFLGHDWPTDVIAFPLGSAPPVGDVYVCPEVAAANARRFGESPRIEVMRLVVHGVLHVLGYEHPAGERRTTSPMWRRQERYLARARRAR